VATSYRIKNYIPRESEVIAGVEHDFTAIVHAIRANVDGSCTARLRSDPADAWRTYTILAGDYIYGEFAAVRRGSFSESELLGLVFALD